MIEDFHATLHTGGINHVVSVPRPYLRDALNLLTTCHGHVFVVDQSTWGESVAIGVSDTGLRCLTEYFGDRI